ncbi:MAG: nickel pincer cofactor biosynthesis protein LarB [Thermomicrobiales bacterium]
MSTKNRPFDDVRRSLDHVSDAELGEIAELSIRLDRSRVGRAGIPEVVFAERKQADAVIAGLRGLVEANGRALASRSPESTIQAIRAALAGMFDLEVCIEARTVVVAQPGVKPHLTGGRVGIITAGSSDAPIAAEASVMAREMGAVVTMARDVGVAGIHRLVEPLERLISDDVDAIVVAAGMDGALPSVVAGLVAVPVIGLPTSIGYGYGGQGVGALMAMLQSCAPGLVVVNIDNGIGAGATAALIANRAADARASR